MVLYSAIDPKRIEGLFASFDLGILN